MATNQRLIGVIGLVFVIAMVLLLLQSQGGVSVTESAFKEIKTTFQDGSDLIIYETPQFLTPEQQKILENYAKETFFFDTVTYDAIRESIRQQAEKLIKSGTSPENFTSELREYAYQQESNTVTKAQLDEIVNEYEQTMVVKSGNLSSYSLNVTATEKLGDPVLQLNYNPESTYKRGQIIAIPIKIVKSTPAPYLFNVVGTCCGMNSVFAQSGVETDGQGNALIKITTHLKFPLGDYTVIISSLSEDNRKINKETFHFRLIE